MHTIRHATPSDWPLIWAMFREVIVAGDAFAYDEHTAEETARKLWVELPAIAFVLELDGHVVGTYYLRPNQPGRGSHVANGGYMIRQAARGRGLAAVLCEHSVATARQLGYRAMQFNFVVSSNQAAIRTWEKFGFQTVGRIPRAFRHVQ